MFTVAESDLVLDALVGLSWAGVSAAAIVDPSMTIPPCIEERPLSHSVYVAGCQVGQLSAADLRGFDDRKPL